MKTQKRLAAALLKVGINRIRVDTKDEEAVMAMTRADVRKAIVRGSIYAVPIEATSRGRIRLRKAAKKKGRGKGHGKWKGNRSARTPSKRDWMKRIRAIRRKLREMKKAGTITAGKYRKLYRLSKAGVFKSKAHVEGAAKGEY